VAYRIAKNIICDIRVITCDIRVII